MESGKLKVESDGIAFGNELEWSRSDTTIFNF